MPMTDEWQSFGANYTFADDACNFDMWVPARTCADDERNQDISGATDSFPDAVPLCVVFAAAQNATQRILAIPVLARALREVHLAGWTQCSVYVQPSWQPSAALLAEIARLAPGLRLVCRDTAPDPATIMVVNGERLPSQHALAAAARDFQASRASGQTGQRFAADARLTAGDAHKLLRAKSRELLDATAKPGDGIVTRYLNRPVSQWLTCSLLRMFGTIHPNVATAGTALIGAAMFACQLLLPGQTGLVLGAVMFQAASVFDGVDGEIARATFRATPLGATADSLVDAAVNILFFGGVIANLYNQGDPLTAGIGIMAIAGFVFGTVLLGYNARRHRGVIDFNSVKQLTGGQNSPVMQVLTWLTMRDFYAFAALVLIGFGFVVTAVWAFAIIVAGWLCVVCFKLAVRGSDKATVRIASA